MTKHRYYIQMEEGKPEFDLWLELHNKLSPVPEICIYYNGEAGKESIVTLTATTAARMANALTDLIASATKTYEDYVAEPND